MSRLAEFRALEKELAARMAELDHFKNDEALKKEVEFEKKLRDLMAKYGHSLRDVMDILDPKGSLRRPQAAESKAPRRPRKVKQYKNPHNGEVIETKGGNHSLLKQWKEKWGSDEVEKWLTN